MSLRKSFDSFTPQHKLRDAEEAYVQAVYRLRSAEEAYEQNMSDLKREIDFLFRKVGHYRHCLYACLLYTSPSPRDMRRSRMPSSA